MMMCPKCNSRVPDNASFCTNCGVPFVTKNDQPAQATTVLTADMYIQRQAEATAAQEQYVNTYHSQNNNVPPMPQGSIAQLKTNRSWIKTALLSLVTLGIYGLITYGQITDDVNLVCSRYDGRKSMNYYLLVFLVTPFTAGIAAIVWMHNICDRIGNELKRRQIDFTFGAKDFWLWSILGSLILVGPFIFAHKFFKAVNLMNDSFNKVG